MATLCPGDSGTVERDLLEAVNRAQAKYESAPPEERKAAKEQHTKALIEFSAHCIMRPHSR